jgi:hypothetical protein
MVEPVYPFEIRRRRRRLMEERRRWGIAFLIR